MRSTFVIFMMIFELLLPGLAVSSDIDWKIRIELVACEPEGFINRMKERMNPAEFWFEQSVVLTRAVDTYWDGDVEYGPIGGIRKLCNDIKNIESRQRCFARRGKVYEAKVECLRYAKQQSKRYGLPK